MKRNYNELKMADMVEKMAKEVAEKTITRAMLRENAMQLKDMVEEEVGSFVDKMTAEEVMGTVLYLVFDEILTNEKHLIHKQLLEYKQTLAGCIFEQDYMNLPMDVKQIPTAMKKGWEVYKTSSASDKEEKKRLVWDTFYDSVKKRNNVVVETLCDTFEKLSSKEEDE